MRATRWYSLILAGGLLVFFGSVSCHNHHGTQEPPPANLTYPTSTIVAIQGVPILPDNPTTTGGEVTSFSVSPALPPGLNLDASTGSLAGTPTAVAAAATYNVVAANGTGSTTFSLTITVAGPALGIQDLPNLGQKLSPLAPPNARFQPLNPNLPDNPTWLASQAVTTSVSPDGKTLLILTSGFNRYYDSQQPPAIVPADSNQYVFIYDISAPTAILAQVLPIKNTYHGMTWDPSQNSTVFYVAGGPDDDVHIVSCTPGTPGSWVLDAPPAVPSQAPLALGHAKGALGLGMTGCSAGVAVASDGQTLVVANYANDSITCFQGGFGNWQSGTEIDLRPGKSLVSPQPGVAGGEYPFWVCVRGTGTHATAYVSSLRDREIDVVDLTSQAVTARIAVKGQPNRMVLDRAQAYLYVSEDQTDTVDVIDTVKNVIAETIPVLAPPSMLAFMPAKLTGANTNSVTLAPDEKQLYVTNGNLNCVAVVPLGGTHKGDQVAALIPTGWYPNSVSFSNDGNTVYVVNGKSPTGANPGFYYSAFTPTFSTHPVGGGSNLYNPQLTKAGFQSFPRPSEDQLATLTVQVAANDRFFSTDSEADTTVMTALKGAIKHVIFIIKENRTYDQILGDLPIGNGDPDLAEFGQNLTPNHHNLALNFVTLDNLYASSESSTDGWPWTTQARCPDVIQQQWPMLYASRGLSGDADGSNRNVNVAIPTLAGRVAANPLLRTVAGLDEDLLPGPTDVGSADGPDGEINTGHLWDSALRAGLTVRNYGFFVDTILYSFPALGTVSLTTGNGLNSLNAYHAPFANGIKVATPQNAALAPLTDLYFRGFDNACPDFYRYAEWAREFDTNYAAGGLPNLSLVRLMHDHTGNFVKPGQAAFLPLSPIGASDGLDSPEAQIADNDYAAGLLVQKIANSIYAKDTLIFIIEDDSQDGPDHVDSHRTVAFVAGAYVNQRALVSTPYNTVNFVRTIEEVLGLPPLNLNDALARPMTEVFNLADLKQGAPSPWSYTAVPSPLLYTTGLAPLLPPAPAGMLAMKPRHHGSYWAKATKGMNFSVEDDFDFGRFNRITWRGVMGNQSYPAVPTGKDLRANRQALLAHHDAALKGKVHSDRTPAAQRPMKNRANP